MSSKYSEKPSKPVIISLFNTSTTDSMGLISHPKNEKKRKSKKSEEKRDLRGD